MIDPLFELYYNDVINLLGKPDYNLMPKIHQYYELRVSVNMAVWLCKKSLELL